MRLKFKTSQVTHYRSDIILKKIYRELREQKYHICASNKNSVTFDEDLRQWFWNLRMANRLHGGCFTVNVSEDVTVVELNYSLKLLPVAVVLFILLIIAIIAGEYIISVFIALGIVIAQLIQILVSQFVANNMLNDILG